MKYILTSILVVLLSLSCNNNNDDRLFEMPLRDVNFDLPAGLNTLDAHYFEIKNIPTNTIDVFNTFGANINNITAIEPGKATLINLFGASGFNFCGEIAVRMFSDNIETRTEIFYLDPVQVDAGPTVNLIPSDVDLTEYLKEETVHIEIKFGRMRTPSPESMEVRLELDFNVR